MAAMSGRPGSDAITLGAPRSEHACLPVFLTCTPTMSTFVSGLTHSAVPAFRADTRQVGATTVFEAGDADAWDGSGETAGLADGVLLPLHAAVSAPARTTAVVMPAMRS